MSDTLRYNRFMSMSRSAALAALAAFTLMPAAARATTLAEWKAKLPPATYTVMFEAGTEAPFSSPLDHETAAGIYYCAACDLALYSSKTKYDSGTGWPSFYRPLPNAVLTKVDTSIPLETRTEVHCRRCSGHLGHVFDDGPKPTGLRYCMNGVALRFQAGASD
jgi:peptide-methionine (R)-S-oxide reductase